MVLVQIGNIEYKDWIALKEIAPKKYHALVDYCINLIEEARHIERINPEFITSGHMRQVNILAFAILSEYNKFIYMGNLPKEELDKVVVDIKGSLRIFFDNIGKQIDWSIYFSKRSSEEIANYMQVLFAQLVTFIETRVYHCIIYSYNQCFERNFDAYFLLDTKLKAGLYTKPPEKPELSELKPEESEEEKPKKKKKGEE